MADLNLRACGKQLPRVVDFTCDSILRLPARNGPKPLSATEIRRSARQEGRERPKYFDTIPVEKSTGPRTISRKPRQPK
eukprot:scaffold646401_cov27-Prasinocladus_malaysianus.AAC.1